MKEAILTSRKRTQISHTRVGFFLTTQDTKTQISDTDFFFGVGQTSTTTKQY